eukprot:TRINITY_DN12148_c0_g1_i1.p2 TRINITY_DN12148_c0_g1~~TRINITY_DN12148_c0_g1_i1.p2  ORF type:complete len:227 (-),score=28.91 TRINITY_DN12148_c0_g1_i1:197-877(-)
MRTDESCKILCRIEALSDVQTKVFQERIEDDYRVNMILDNLPVGMVKFREEEGGMTQRIKTYERGFAVGLLALIQDNSEEYKYFLNNHLRFTILYHFDAVTDLSRIVGFEVEPFTVEHSYDGSFDGQETKLDTCNVGKQIRVSHEQKPQAVEEGKEVIFTYDVIFQKSEIKWASRWDTYLLMMDDQIHWFSIINSLMIVLFLSGMVAMIMMRTLHRDIAKYNQLES